MSTTKSKHPIDAKHSYEIKNFSQRINEDGYVIVYIEARTENPTESHNKFWRENAPN